MTGTTLDSRRAPDSRRTPDSRWADDSFLDSLRQQTDPLADATVAELIRDGDISAINKVFQLMDSDAVCDPIPTDSIPAFEQYLERSGTLPDWVDLKRIERGEDIYFQHALPLALILLAKSLPEGYSAPALTRILHLSGDLEHHPYRRLLGVLQMVVNVSSCGGFSDDGTAVLTAQKLRLLHAGVRVIADKAMPDYRERFGPPVNHEDMLATIMGFSYLVIEGLQLLEVGLSDDEAEDLYYTWRVFAQMMGIHPPDAPADHSFIPQSIAEAKLFYDAYSRRHFTAAAGNPEGVLLARHNLEMMQQFIPRLLRLLGFGIVPRIYMNELLSPETLQRVEIRPVTGHRFLKWLFLSFPRWFQRHADKHSMHAVDSLAQMIFQGMIVKAYGGKVHFLVPDSIADLRKLA